MTRARDLARVRFLCSSAVDLMTQMPLLADALRSLVPSFSLSMIRVDDRCVPTEHYSEHFDEVSHQLFAASSAHFASRSADPAAFANLMTNADPVGALVHAPPGYVEGVIYQHLFARNGIHHTLDVALKDGDGAPLAILGIFRERRTRAFDADDVARIRSVYPHLVHACRAPTAESVFDEAGSSLLVVDAQGRVQWASVEARAQLAEAVFGAERTHLVKDGVVPSACRVLVAALARARSRRASDADARVPALTLRVAGGRLRLRAYALEPGPLASTTYVGVQITREVDRRLQILAAIDAARLTPQQSRIAWAIVRGLSGEQIASELELGRTTLKSYQKDLYRRLDVDNGRGVVARLEALGARAAPDLTRHRPA